MVDYGFINDYILHAHTIDASGTVGSASHLAHAAGPRGSSPARNVRESEPHGLGVVRGPRRPVGELQVSASRIAFYVER